jgi:hypothetical protein
VVEAPVDAAPPAVDATPLPVDATVRAADAAPPPPDVARPPDVSLGTDAEPLPLVDDFDRPDGPLVAGVPAIENKPPAVPLKGATSWWNYVQAHKVQGNRLMLALPTEVHTASFWYQEGKPNQEVELTIATAGSKGEVVLIMKCDPRGSYWHRLYVTYGFSGRVQVLAYDDANKETRVGDPIDVRMLSGDRFRARATADGTLTIYRNGTVIGTRDLTSWKDPTIGRAYYQGGGHFGFVFRLSETTTALDDFRARSY